MSQCTIKDCPNAAVAKGLCPQHYMRVRRTGSATTTLKPGPKPKSKPGNGIDVAALEAEIARLTAENAALRREAEARPASPPPPQATTRPQLHRPPPTPVTEPPLSMSAQQRLDAAIRREKARLNAEHARRMAQIDEDVRTRVITQTAERLAWIKERETEAEQIKTTYQRLINNRNHPLTNAEYTLLHLCVRGDASEDKRHQAGVLLNDKRLKLTGQEPPPPRPLQR